MADVVERLPFPISKRLGTAVEDVLAKNGRDIHLTIGGIPFRLGASKENPVLLETAGSQKDQQDTEPEAGEQTLAGWWLRSQASWHQGAGYEYAESRGEVKESNYFLDSLNVDPWTQGKLTLLRRAVEVSSSAHRSVAVVPSDAVYQTIVGQAGAVRMYEQLGGGLVTNLYIPGAINFDSVIATEALWFAAGDDAKVYSKDLLGVTTTPNVWSLTGASTSKPTRIFWAKHRLWAINGNKIYWIDYATPGTTAAPAATVALYTHPSTSWNYTDIADATATAPPISSASRWTRTARRPR
jgi:hypothetical protein